MIEGKTKVIIKAKPRKDDTFAMNFKIKGFQQDGIIVLSTALVRYFISNGIPKKELLELIKDMYEEFLKEENK